MHAEWIGLWTVIVGLGLGLGLGLERGLTPAAEVPRHTQTYAVFPVGNRSPARSRCVPEAQRSVECQLHDPSPVKIGEIELAD